MNYEGTSATKRIRFSVRAADPDLIDKLAFVHLIKMKFYGEEVAAKSLGTGKKRTLEILVQFGTYNHWSEAKLHCDRNVNELGNILADYKGALDYADPNRMAAEAMKDRALGQD